MFDEVIACYTLLELRHKAAEVIKQRIQEKETPKLWCLLGDATDNLECYHKALNLSNNRSARAYRSIGLHHYFDKDYERCIPLFEKSLDLSSFQPLLVLRLAFSSMEIKNWKVWDNLMVLSLDIGAFNDVIRSYERILDIKQSHIDNQVLDILGRAVIDNLEDCEGNEAGRLREKFQKLLARLTVAMPKEAVAWRVYGDIIALNTNAQNDI